MKLRSSLFQFASATLLIAAFGPTPLAAQDATDELTSLDEITISGSGLPTEVMKSASSVTVLSEEDIKKSPPASVAKILQDIPGIMVNESGIERIRIRGESSQRVAILIDGQRISDHTTYGTPILIAPTEIERIEVVRGPSSVVSGNRAIGGVVNIITKRGADTPVEITTSAGYLGPNDGYRAAASLAGTVENFDYRLSLSRSDLNDRESALGPVVPSGGEDRDIHAFLGYDFGNHYVGVRAQDFDLAADVFTGSPAFTIDLPKRDLRKYSAFYEGTDLTPWMSMLKLDTYTQTVDRQFRNAFTVPTGPGATMTSRATSDDRQTTSGLRATANLEFAPGHRTVVGFEYENDQLETTKTAATIFSPAPPVSPPPGVSFADASIKTSSVFAQHEATFGKLTGTLGLRYYNVESTLDQYIGGAPGGPAPGTTSTDDRVLGSLGLVYELSDDTVLRAGISQGYTHASLAQLYLTSVGRGGTVSGNPNLKPETATNYEVGVRVDRSNLVLDAAVFYTQSKDYIATQTTTPGFSTYRNVDDVDSFGFEVSAEFNPAWTRGIRPYVTLSHVRREFKYANGFSTTDSGVPEWSGTMGLGSDWAAGTLGGTWDVFVRAESNAVQRSSANVVTERTGGWGTFNLRGTMDISENLTASLEVGNIFDKSYRSIDQVQGAGRNVSVFVTATF
jgi:hemoglobin/transferrin/lactoferrin receptor protein